MWERKNSLHGRLFESDFFAGVGYTLVDTSNTFELSPAIPTPGLPGIEFDSRSAAMSVMLNYDSRDNFFTPSRGIAAEIKVMAFNGAWGSDQDFEKYSAMITYYTKLHEKWVMGLRGSAKGVDGDAPFYAYPYIDMRGIKAMQYQGVKHCWARLNCVGHLLPAGYWSGSAARVEHTAMGKEAIWMSSTAKALVCAI